jgi:signal transduction histidine kinase
MEIVNLPISLQELNHKLRIPLTGILGNAVLLNKQNLTLEQKRSVADIITSGNALLALADHLLDAKNVTTYFGNLAQPLGVIHEINC